MNEVIGKQDVRTVGGDGAMFDQSSEVSVRVVLEVVGVDDFLSTLSTAGG